MDEVASQDVMSSRPEDQEPRFNQIQVNDILKKERQKIADKMQRDMEAKYQAQQAEQQPAHGLGGMQSVDPERLKQEVRDDLISHIQKLAADEERKQHEAAADQAVNQFFMKLNTGKNKYSDFDEVMKGFEPSAFPQLSILAGQFENTADIMYDLSSNPMKLAQIQVLVERQPDMAKRELEKLSQSISKNQQALQENVSPREPLSRLKSSTSVGADTGQMTLKDFKKADWLRR
jgi:hypothetical protein